jgi:allantoinase
MTVSTIIRGQRVLTERGLRPASIRIRNGTITAVSEFAAAPAQAAVIDAGDDIVMPGLVDTHVHVNEPGRTEWEGFASATRSAAAGGVTTLFDMPLNSIPATTTLAALHAKRDAARDRIAVNVGFIGGVVPGNARELRPMYDAGVRMFKCFLVPSGVDEFPCVTEADLREAMPILAALQAPLLVHAELPEHIVPVPQGDPCRYATYLASRPVIAETAAIELVIRLAEQLGTRVHIVHLSSHLSLALIRAARSRGVAITCETCPHYLTFAADEIADGRTDCKCAPPIRDAATREALWRGVLHGEIDLIASDHSPCPPDMKSPADGDFFQAWGGIASLQLGLPAVWHEARQRGASIDLLVEKMSTAPARLAGVGHRKGRLAEGYDADLVIWNPDAPVDVDAITLYHRHSLTPYRGCTLTGAVRATYVGGVEVYRDGRVTNNLPGQIIS